MNISTGRYIHETRKWILHNMRCQSVQCRSTRRWRRLTGSPKIFTWEAFRDTLLEQAEQGVDYFTIHAGVLLAMCR